MKNLFIILLFAIIDAIPGSKIAMVNEHKSQAENAMKEKDYAKAIENYSFLVDSLGLEDEGLKLNLANAYYLDFKNISEELSSKTNDGNSEENKEALAETMENVKKMTPIYEVLCRSTDKIIRGRANNQAGNLAMGAISFIPASYKDAVPLFKEALKAEPMNEEYRYNYELAKKLAEEQEKKEEEKKDENKDDKKEEKKEEEKKNEEEKKKEEEQKKEGEKKDDNKEGDEKKENSDNEKQKKDAEKEKEGKEGEEKDNKEDGEKGDKKSEEKKEGEKQGEKGEKEGVGGKEGEKTEEQKKEEIKKQMQKRLQNINMTNEKAKMILNAMRNQEKQYYQQMQKGKKKKKDKSKPDW